MLDDLSHSKTMGYFSKLDYYKNLTKHEFNYENFISSVKLADTRENLEPYPGPHKVKN